MWWKSLPLAFGVVAAASALGTVAIAEGLRPAAGPGGAAPFLERVMSEIARNDYGRAWLSLYPRQQREIPQREYVTCELTSPIPGRLVALEVVRIRRDSVRVAGGPANRIGATAVTFRIRLSDPAIPASVVIVHTVHAIRVAGRWAWILPAARYRLHRSGTCTARTDASTH